ncbi:MAG: hypothetical protein AAB091_01005, partial [Elusimicrobiota bacterium]
KVAKGANEAKGAKKAKGAGAGKSGQVKKAGGVVRKKQGGQAKVSEVERMTKTENLEAAKGTSPVKKLSSFKIAFNSNDARVSESQRGMLSDIGQTARLHPGERFSLIGYASPDEDKPENLAESRAREVAKILAGDYGIAGSRLNVEYGLGESGQRMVNVFVEQ